MSLILCLVLIVALVGCSEPKPQTIAIADQFGLAYAPLEIMKQKNLLEKYLAPGVEVKWVKLANTTAIREAMVADELDIGFMAIPPFLIGMDNGMPWRMMTGLSSSPLGLVTNAADVSSLADLVGKGKIALPQPGSIQHILLAMAADRELGDPKAFDTYLLALKHPDGYQALLTQPEVVGFFTAPPYLNAALKHDGHRLLLTGEEAFQGDFTFIVGVCQEDFFKEKSQYEAFLKAMDEAIAFIQNEPEETTAILAAAYDLTPEEIHEQVYNQGLAFGREIHGVETFMQFMLKTGYIKNRIETKDTVWQE